MNSEYAEEVAGRIVEQLKQGTAPWQKPWQPGELRLPYNATTGKEYRGMNTIWLHMQGYGDPRWMTYRQAAAEGAQVRKESRGTRILYWKFHDERAVKDEQGRPALDGEGRPRMIRTELERPRVFTAVVFNAQQIDGLPPIEVKPLGPEPERHARAEAILANSGARIAHVAGDRAYYQPGTDSITLPERQQFKSSDAYYATALHELGHWSGHESRLDRDLSHPFGSAGYAREELRAEIASLMLGERLEIGHDPGQHVAYVASWIKELEEDPREIFRAAADAEKINGYVMAFELDRQLTAEQQQSAHPERAAGVVVVAHSPRNEPLEERSMTSQRTYLIVPYREKDVAKKAAQDAGFRLQWDKDAKAWFVPEGIDVKQTGVARWLPENVRHMIERPVSPEESFAAAIQAAGLQLDGPPIMDGRFHRATVEGDKGAEQSGSYAGHREGRLPGGIINNFRTGERINWKYEGKVESISSEDRARLDAEATARNQRRADEIAAQHDGVAKIAEAIWKEAPPASADHPYCANKGIAAPSAHGLRVVPATVSDEAMAAGVRIARTAQQAKSMRATEPDARVFIAGDLLVPVLDGAGKLWSVQSINPQFKGFMKDGRKAGLYTVAGADPSAFAATLDKDPTIPLVLAEGYATGDTVSRLLGHPVAVAFDSGNLDSGNLDAVARSLRERWPDRPLLIAADNDHRKEIRPDGKPGINVGLKKAQEVAYNHKGGVMVPRFDARDEGSDWNDYARQHGDETARKELSRQMAQARTEAAMTAERMTVLARAQEAEARNDPTTSADDAQVTRERTAAHGLMARAVAGSAEVRAEATDALVANVNGAGRPIAAVSATVARTTAEMQDDTKEARQHVLDGHNISTKPQEQQRAAPRRAKERDGDAGL